MGHKIFNGNGQPIEIPRGIDAASATNFRDIYVQSDRMKFMSVHEQSGLSTPHIATGHARAQLPWVVILLQYNSKFQISPQRREYFLYAPSSLNSAAMYAYELWRKWEKKLRKHEVRWNVDPEDDFPRIADGIIAQPIDDAAYEEAWKFVKKMDPLKYCTDGNPSDPIAFTTLDDSVKLFRMDDDISDIAISM
jgi:hypothetical protein